MKHVLFYRTSLYEPDSTKIVIYDFDHKTFLKVAKNVEVQKVAVTFQRYMNHNGEDILLDKKRECYLGAISYLTDIAVTDIDFYLKIENQKNINKTYQNYIIHETNGFIFLPEPPYKVFNENLEMLNKVDPDNNENLILQLIKAEEESFKANKALAEQENKETAQFINKMAELTALNRN